MTSALLLSLKFAVMPQPLVLGFMGVLADDSGPSGMPDLGVLAQYGVLGVFAIILLLFARVSYKRETDRSDRLEAEVNRLNTLIVDRVIPALTSAATAVQDATELLRDFQRERELASLREQASRHARPPEDRRYE